MTSNLTFSEYDAQLFAFMQSRSFRPPASSAKTDDRFNALALSLFALQFKAVLPYRQFCAARNATPENVRHWSQIPAMPVAGFKEFELTSLPSAQRTRVFHSSGTTGQQTSRQYHSAESLAIYEASLLRWFVPHFMADPTLSFLALTPPPVQAPNSSLVHMFEAIFNHSSDGTGAFTGHTDHEGAWHLKLKATLGLLNQCATADQPVAIFGTAFNFVHLLTHLQDLNLRLRLPPGSRILETGGYKGRSLALPKPELYALITRLLDIPANRIVSEYGMCELSSQAYDLEIPPADSMPPAAPRTFLFPPWARIQIISPETGLEVADGETGLIRVFDLANVRSVMAVQTEDLGIRRGSGFELLGRAALAESRGCSLMSA